MFLSGYISLRYLFSKKSRNAINIISWLSVVVVAVSTAALIIVFSVFNGFNEIILSMQKSYDPELKITPAKGKTFFVNDSIKNIIAQTQGIENYSEVLEENALIKNKSKQVIAILKGVDDNYEKTVNVSDFIGQGEYNVSSSKKKNIVIGAVIAYKLSVFIDFPSFLDILIPNRLNKNIYNPTSAFNTAKAMPFGITSVDEEFDSKYIFANIAFVRELTNRKSDEVSSLELKIKNEYDTEEVKSELETKFGQNFTIKNRHQQHASMYKVMETEKWATFFILSFIILIASFSIISSLTMLIIEKKEDIFTMKSMGAGNFFIKKTFVLTGWFISVLGALIGLTIGGIISLLQQKYGLLEFPDGENLIISTYPVKFLFSDFILSLASVSFIGFFTALLPILFNGKKIF